MSDLTTKELQDADAAITHELEQRAADQDAAMAAAFVAGTLPEEDRRAPEADASPVAVGDAVQPDVSVSAEQYIAETMAALPAGSSFSWSDGVYRVQRGPHAFGEGKTLARAIRVIGATRGTLEGEGPFVLFDESGAIIPAE